MKFARSIGLVLLSISVLWQTSLCQSPTPGQNVNMVSGTTWPYGDPFLERQDEPSLAVSTRNSLHLLAGANDYRTVDLNLPEAEPGELTMTSAPIGTGEPWVGQYVSIDGGARWQSTLLPGYPQDTSPQGLASPLHGFTTAADPVIASGTNGMFYYAGIAFNRGASYGAMFVARYMDLNNKENGDITQDSFPIRYINTVPVAFGSNMPAQFLDKPALAVDIPRGSATCSLSVPQGGTSVSQTIPAGNVYVAYANVASSNGGQTSTINFSRSTNCGASWSAPIAISQRYTLSQGATIQVDPETGIVYVAWRVIRSAQQPNDGIAIAASLDGGRTFFSPITLVSLPPFSFANPTAAAFFDQNTTGASFRTTAYPALAVADSGIAFIPGPIYLAWSQRGVGPNREARIMMLAIPGNANFSNGTFTPPTPFPLDNGPITNDEGGVFNLTSGFQLMPAMTFNQGKLMVLYYDLRQDHTIGEFTPSVSNGAFTPDAKGNFFEETRDQVGENPDPSLYSPYFISDAGLTVRRHTIDVVLAEANASFSTPTFGYARVSQYDLGLFTGESAGESAPFHQLKFNPPNLPMFIHGTGAFMGDYLGISGQPFVLVKCGNSQCWTYNNPSPPGVAGTFLAAPKPAPTSAVHYASWTSNQDVIPPIDNDWTKYTAIGSGTSVYDRSTTLSCTPGYDGTRNQNVYSSRITQGLLVSSPQSSKPLSLTVERGFVVLVQNHTSGRSTANGPVNYFRLAIANQPVNGFASFTQLVPPSPVTSQRIRNFSRVTSIDAAIAPHTGIARTIFAVSSSPTASILVNVTEIDAFGGRPIQGGLSSFILLNADGTVPSGLVDPNGKTGSGSIAGVELYDPNVSAPNVSAPNVSAPNVSAPNVSAPNVSAANVCSPNVSAPNVSAPNVSAPNVSACGVASPNVSAPNVSAPNVSAAPPSDATYSLTNSGNTSASYRVAVVGATTTPLQLLVSQIYMTPQTDGNCNLITQQQNITLANVPNVPVVSPSNLGNPNVSAAPVTETTVSVPPGDTVYFTLRGDVSLDRMREIVGTEVSVAVQPHAIDSNNTTATTPALALFIATAALPDGVVGRPYGFFPPAALELPPSVQLAASGGKAPYTWSIASENLPAGLTLSSSGVLSGTPTFSNLPGAMVTFQVQDSLGVVAIRTFVIRIADPIPAAPTNLTAGALGSGDVNLTWNASTSSVVGYNVYRSNTAGGPYTKLTSPGANLLSYTDTTGIGGQTYFYVVTAFGVENVESLASNEVSALVTIVPVFVGQAVDPTGDALGGGTNPDLVSATITVFNSNMASLSVRFAPGTLNAATTSVEFSLDIDQNVQTGSRGIDGGCSLPDGDLIGTDYIVDLDSGFADNQATIYRATSNNCAQFEAINSALVTIVTDGMDVDVPLSALTNATAGLAARGPWNFKVTVSTFLGDGGFTAILDRMPDTGVAPASTAPPGPPIL
ncbi:MAG TPA: hypothetical protein VJ453_09385 [Terriglobales bacterium]|nr:hypothetical protein [Terriglobales bacterium]